MNLREPGESQHQTELRHYSFVPPHEEPQTNARTHLRTAQQHPSNHHQAFGDQEEEMRDSGSSALHHHRRQLLRRESRHLKVGDIMNPGHMEPNGQWRHQTPIVPSAGRITIIGVLKDQFLGFQWKKFGF